MLPRYPGWFSANLSGTTFFSVGPPAVGNGDLLAFWPVLALGTEKFWARVENTKVQFPGARGTFFGEKSSRPKIFSPKLRNFVLHFAFWPTGPPGAGNREILVF